MGDVVEAMRGETVGDGEMLRKKVSAHNKSLYPRFTLSRRLPFSESSSECFG
ncbi:MAG: hypothetical protein WBB82_00250 [Limnothrix sp.]